jgi:hypothetical protein
MCCGGTTCCDPQFCCGNGECCSLPCEGCLNNGSLSGGTIAVDPPVACIGDTITFTASGVVDSGGVKRVFCSAKTTIPPGGVTYAWTLALPLGYPPPLPPLMGTGAMVNVVAKVAGAYSCTFTAAVTRQCPPGSRQISGSKNVPPHTCTATLADGDGCPGKTIQVARTIQNTSTTCQATFDWEVKKTQGVPTVTPNPAIGSVTLAPQALSQANQRVALDENSQLGSATLELTVSWQGTALCTDPATIQVSCPSQTASGAGALCGTVYGGSIQYCYGCADGQAASNWWFKENVTGGGPGSCQTGTINQTLNPIQSATGCVTDQITNGNGPPGNVAPCSHTTNQTVYAGPTSARVTLCSYSNTQVITVTSNPNPPPNGTVTTSSAGASVSCTY